MIQVTIEDAGRKPMMDAEKSAQLLQFCMDRSERTVLARGHEEELAPEVFERLIAEEAERILMERERELDCIAGLTERALRKDGFFSREQAVEIIHRQAEERLEALEENGSRIFRGRDTVEEDLIPYGLEKREISIGSFTADAPWFDLCWFPKELSVLRAALSGDLFHYPIEIGSYEMMDPCFVGEDGKVWAKINSLERTISMDLSEEDYRAFLALEIRHTAYPPQKKPQSAGKILMIGAVTAASVLGAALGLTVGMKRKKAKERNAAEAEGAQPAGKENA